jgi:uncharacterized alkaline shock family protein YloU
MNDNRETIGRIEVAPEVLTTIARFATLNVNGVVKLCPGTAEGGHRFRRPTRHDGVLLHTHEGAVSFDIYVLMEPNVSLVEASRRLQSAVMEAIDTMVGVPVTAVNVHVEDVVYQQDEVI